MTRFRVSCSLKARLRVSVDVAAQRDDGVEERLHATRWRGRVAVVARDAGSVRRSSSLTLRDPKVQIAAGVNGGHATRCEQLSYLRLAPLPRQPAAHQVADERREGVVRAEAALDHRQQPRLVVGHEAVGVLDAEAGERRVELGGGRDGRRRRAPGRRPSRTRCGVRSHTTAARRSCSTQDEERLAAREPHGQACERLLDARLVDARLVEPHHRRAAVRLLEGASPRHQRRVLWRRRSLLA